MHKENILKSAFVLVMFLAGFVVFSLPSSAENPAAFSLAPLPYGYNALEPAIDSQTMEIHHGKHHQAYVNNLNAAVEKESALRGKTLTQIFETVSDYGAAVRDNAGGHWNHSFFWEIMAPVSQTGAPSESLQKEIDATFGSLDAFKTEFEKAGLSRFGSGWVWLMVNGEGKLQIVSTPNQDNPLMNDAPVKGTPILGNDVWEHAYYLKHQNRRGDYLKGWWSVVNWEKVSAHYAAAQ